MIETPTLKNGYNSQNLVSHPSENTLNPELCIVHIDEEISEPDPIISIAGKALFTKGNISVIGGKQKSRKTFFICMPIVSALIGNYGIFSSNPSHNMKVLLFDCEQARSHSLIVLKRIYKMAGFPEEVDNENIILYSLRENSVKERQSLIAQAIRDQKPDLVVIDGLVDITSDFNSIEKSSEVIQLLMTLSSKYNCHITSVLHENKGDGNLRGHLGSIASQKAETVIQLTKQGDLTKVEGPYTRNIGFNPFSFRINSESIPEISDIKSKSEVLQQEIDQHLKNILKTKSLRYGDLIEAYVRVSKKSEATAKKHISKARNLKLISLEGVLYRYN